MNVYSVSWCGEPRLWSGDTMAEAVQKDYRRWLNDNANADVIESRGEYEAELESVALIGELEG